MRLALLATAAAGLFLAATQIEGLCLKTLVRSADGWTKWTERAQRVPAVVSMDLDHVSLAVGDGPVGHHRARARTLQTIALSGGPVVAIALRGESLALGTFDGGAFRVVDGEAQKLPIDERVNDLAFDESGTLWAATAGGAFRVTASGQATRLAAGAFQAVAIWKNRAWFASPRGLSVAGVDGFVTRGAPQGFRADSPAALAACGALLCVGALDGLWLWDGASARRVGSDSGSLPSDWVTAIAADPTGVWAGTFDAGLARLSPAHRRFAPSDGLPDARIQPHALALSGALAYAGTPAGILELHDGSAALVTEGLPSAEVTALVPAPGGGLWMGHQGGAARIEIEEVLP